MDKTLLLDRAARDGEQRVLLARILDQQERAARRNVPTHTGFLTPAEQAVSADFLMHAAPGQGVLFGGYADAERRLWGFLPDWLDEESWRTGTDCPVRALRAEVPAGAALTHRDWLGALMGLGITREKLGDILLQPDGAQILVLAETAEILLTQWDKVGRWSIRLSSLPLAALTPAPSQTKEVRATVASPRLDAVLAAGFSVPRSRAAELIRSGRVMVDHRPCEKGDRPVAAGAVLTCRGLGKCVLREIGGASRRGRTVLILERYL